MVSLISQLAGNFAQYKYFFFKSDDIDAPFFLKIHEIDGDIKKLIIFPGGPPPLIYFPLNDQKYAI